jgi:hypothetical protein
MDSSVGIVTGLRAEPSEVRMPAGVRDHFIIILQTGSSAHPASSLVVFPLKKCGRAVIFTICLYIAPWLRMSEVYLYSTIRLHGMDMDSFKFFLLRNY